MIRAGGADLVLPLKDQLRTIKCLAGISGLKEPSTIDHIGDNIKIGAVLVWTLDLQFKTEEAKGVGIMGIVFS